MDCHPQTNPWAACDRKNIDRECLAARPEYPAADFSGLRLRQLPDEFDRARIFVREQLIFSRNLGFRATDPRRPYREF